MNKMFSIIFLLLPFAVMAQKQEDTRVIISFSDTSDYYEKARIALVKNDFMVKDLGRKDSIFTYMRELKQMPGFAILIAAIDKDKVTLSGYYGTKRVNDFGYTASPKIYKPIVYFRGSKTWKLLLQVANDIGSSITFAK